MQILIRLHPRSAGQTLENNESKHLQVQKQNASEFTSYFQISNLDSPNLINRYLSSRENQTKCGRGFLRERSICNFYKTSKMYSWEIMACGMGLALCFERLFPVQCSVSFPIHTVLEFESRRECNKHVYHLTARVRHPFRSPRLGDSGTVNRLYPP